MLFAIAHLLSSDHVMATEVSIAATFRESFRHHVTADTFSWQLKPLVLRHNDCTVSMYLLTGLHRSVVCKPLCEDLLVQRYITRT